MRIANYVNTLAEDRARRWRQCRAGGAGGRAGHGHQVAPGCRKAAHRPRGPGRSRAAHSSPCTLQDYVRVVHAGQEAPRGTASHTSASSSPRRDPRWRAAAGTVGGDSTARLIREARLDEDIKAVVLARRQPGWQRAGFRADLPGAAGAAARPASPSWCPWATWRLPAATTSRRPRMRSGQARPRSRARSAFSRSFRRRDARQDRRAASTAWARPPSGQLRIDRPLGEESAKSCLQSTVGAATEFLARVAMGARRIAATSTRSRRAASGRERCVKRFGPGRSARLFDDAVKSAARRAKLQSTSREFIEPELSLAEELALELQTRVWFAQTFYGDVVKHVPFGARVARARARAARDRALAAPRLPRPSRFAYCFCSAR